MRSTMPSRMAVVKLMDVWPLPLISAFVMARMALPKKSSTAMGTYFAPMESASGSAVKMPNT